MGTEYLTTKQVAETQGLKSREVTVYARKYGLLPNQTFGGQPMWSKGQATAFAAHYGEMKDGSRCPECGRMKDAPEQLRENGPTTDGTVPHEGAE